MEEKKKEEDKEGVVQYLRGKKKKKPSVHIKRMGSVWSKTSTGPI